MLNLTHHHVDSNHRDPSDAWAVAKVEYDRTRQKIATMWILAVAANPTRRGNVIEIELSHKVSMFPKRNAMMFLS